MPFVVSDNFMMSCHFPMSLRLTALHHSATEFHIHYASHLATTKTHNLKMFHTTSKPKCLKQPYMRIITNSKFPSNNQSLIFFQKKKKKKKFFANTYPVPNLRLNSQKNKKKGHNFRTELFSIMHWKKRF